MEEEKKAILSVSFGTGCGETGERAIGAIERELKEKFPGWEVRRAFTGSAVIRVLRERDGIVAETPKQALERLAGEGYRTVVIQPTYVIGGMEYEKLLGDVEPYRGVFGTLVCGRPLLDSVRDCREVAAVLGRELSSCRKPENRIVLIGHGTEHAGNAAYEELRRACREEGLDDFLVGTVKAACGSESDIEAEMGMKAVVLVPLLVTAGSHAARDIAGTGENSWRTRFEKRGFRTVCVMRGLGEYEGIRRIYVRHASEALAAARDEGNGKPEASGSRGSGKPEASGSGEGGKPEASGSVGSGKPEASGSGESMRLEELGDR